MLVVEFGLSVEVRLVVSCFYITDVEVIWTATIIFLVAATIIEAG